MLASVASATIIPADKGAAISLDGVWRFKLEQAKRNYEGQGEKPIIPIDYPKSIEPFHQLDYREDDKWHDLKVPGNWEMAGYSPATYNQTDNASGLYRLQFDMPADWKGREVRIDFDGIQNAAEVWLNGQPGRSMSRAGAGKTITKAAGPPSKLISPRP